MLPTTLHLFPSPLNACFGTIVGVSQGLRVFMDELLVGDVRLVMLVPQWFPKAHVTFDWQRLQGERVSIVFVLRGTMQVSGRNSGGNIPLQHSLQLFTDGAGCCEC
jgi:hypothetical protein